MRSIIYILQNDTALTTLLGGSEKIGMNLIGQTIQAPYVTVDVEDTDPTTAFVESSDLDFVRFTVFCVADLSFTSGSTVGADEVSKAVRAAIDKNNAIAGTYDSETITRCTLERGGQFQNNSIANKPQITKEDEYMLSLRVDKVAAPTNLVLTPNYNWLNLAYSAVGADSVNIYLSIDGGSSTFLANTSDLTEYDYFQAIDEVNLLEFSIEAVVGSQTSTRVSFSPYKTWLLDPVLDINARNLDQYTLNGTGVTSYESLDPDGVLMSAPSTAQEPTVDSATVPAKMTFDGVSDVLSNTEDVERFAGLYRGRIEYINDADTVDSDFHVTFTRNTANTQYLTVGLSGGKLTFSIRRGNDIFNTLTADATPVINQRVVWVSTGTEYKLFLDGIDSPFTIDVGNNDGAYIDSVDVLTTVSLGATVRASTFYSLTTVKSVSISGQSLTDTKELERSNYIKEIHNL